MRRFFIALAIFLIPTAAAAQSAQNLTVRDVIALSRADLGEEALLALIEVNRPIFPVDVATLKSLKEAGVPTNVITAMIRSGRTPPPLAESLEVPEPPVAPQADAPQVIVIDHHEEPLVREVPVAVPIYVAVPTRRIRDDHHGVRLPVVRPSRPVEPVFWGWGGKLRPDAWKPIELQKDAKIEVQKK